MDDAIIRDQLKNIFPQIDICILQGVLDEARIINEGEDILTRCIENILDQPQASRVQVSASNDREEMDDVVIVKSIKKGRAVNEKANEIPVVFVDEDKTRTTMARDLPKDLPLISDSTDSDSDVLGLEPDTESSDEFTDNFIIRHPIALPQSSYSSTVASKHWENSPTQPSTVSNPRQTPVATHTDAVQTSLKVLRKHSRVNKYQQTQITPNQPKPVAKTVSKWTPEHSFIGQIGSPTDSFEGLILTPEQLLPKAYKKIPVTVNKQSAETFSNQKPEPSVVSNHREVPLTDTGLFDDLIVNPEQQHSKGDKHWHIPTNEQLMNAVLSPVAQVVGLASHWETTETLNQAQSSTVSSHYHMPESHNLANLVNQTVTNPLSSSSTTSQQEAMTSMVTSVLPVVTQMFPGVNKLFVQNLCQKGYDVNAIVNVLLDRPDMQKSSPSEPQPCLKKPIEAKSVDYFKEYSKPVSSVYYNQCHSLLKNEFQRVSVLDIKKAMGICNKHYAPTRKLLEQALLALHKHDKSPQDKSLSSGGTQSQNFTITRLLASKRPKIYVSSLVDNELQLEIDFVKKQAMLEEEKKNAIYAAHLNEQQYKDEGQLIECGCCFGEFPFEEVVQCSDGHLFCKECLRGYAKEIIFGSSMATATLTCMGEDCDRPFPYSQLEKCLTKSEIEKYQGRLQEDCLAKAKIPNLQQCPFCEFAAIIPEQEKVLVCMNPVCLKESCKECKEEWKDHFGLKCNEIEKKPQTNLRVSYEERMTMAKIRKCTKCSLTFTKQDGCNKITCRCGASQCYVCRQPDINYNHFCRHVRDPGCKCTKCSACSLWTDTAEDEELAIKQLQEEAATAKRKLDEEIEMTAKIQKV